MRKFYHVHTTFIFKYKLLRDQCPPMFPVYPKHINERTVTFQNKDHGHSTFYAPTTKWYWKKLKTPNTADIIWMLYLTHTIQDDNLQTQNLTKKLPISPWNALKSGIINKQLSGYFPINLNSIECHNLCPSVQTVLFVGICGRTGILRQHEWG